ncbi:MAG: hypothetical protein RID09_17285 [Coleofasciculus sp. G1-WW12-02]
MVNKASLVDCKVKRRSRKRYEGKTPRLRLGHLTQAKKICDRTLT